MVSGAFSFSGGLSMRPMFAFLVLVSAARADFPIVYCRVPLTPGQDPRINQIDNPLATEPNTDIVLWRPDGTETVLFDAAPEGGVFDLCMDYAAEYVYFSYTPKAGDNGNFFDAGSDIYRVKLDGTGLEQLTHGETTPIRLPVSDRSYAQNCGSTYFESPTGPRILFTSSRNNLHQMATSDAWGRPVLQLFAMDTDGKNVEQVGYLNLGGAQHPFVLTNGKAAWFSWETHGLRQTGAMGMWESLPDGRSWGPLWSAFYLGLSSLHFGSQTPDGRLQISDYYPNQRPASGNLYDWKPYAGFGSPDPSQNVVLRDAKGPSQFPFQPLSPFGEPPTRSLVPFTTNRDDGPPWRIAYPSGAPGGLLVNRVHFTAVKPVNIDAVDVGYMPLGQVAESETEIRVLFDHPEFAEIQCKPAVPYASIYGSVPPVHPWVPNPSGEPYGYVGTSGVYARESKPFLPNTDLKWGQGGDVGTYSNSEIHAIRILVQRPTPRTDSKKTKLGWTVHRDERMAVLGEIALRKFNPDGSPLLDSAGDPDTSFLAKIPADTSYTFQLVDRDGAALTTAMTWHQSRPGEVRTDCRGCHAHHQPGIEFEGTAASKADYQFANLTHATPESAEWYRHIKPILQAHCADCHAGQDADMDGVPDRVNLLDDNLRANLAIVKPFQARRSPLYRMLLGLDGVTMPANGPPLTPEQIRKIALWIDTGAARDDTGTYSRDDQRPTLFAELTGDALRIAADDIDSRPVTVTVDGVPVTLTDNKWTGPSRQTSRIVATDAAGNESVRELFLREGTPPDPPDPPMETFEENVLRRLHALDGETYP